MFEKFSKDLQKLIEKKGFIEPTLAQKMSFLEVMNDKDILLLAATGTGKTESAMLPIFDKIHTEKNKPISVIYITPTRSLNRDLLDRLFWWADKLELDISVRHGDTTQRERAEQREMPPDILISTPETIGAVLTGKKIREHLRNVDYVIIDEIHELAESKRGTQLTIILERLKNLAGNFQRIGLSATVGSPQKIANFLGDDVKIINAQAQKQYDIKVEYPYKVDTKTVDDLLLEKDVASRLIKIHDIIKNNSSVLVFTNTRQTAEVISSRLKSYDPKLKQNVHHGSLSKSSRIDSESKFKTEEIESLICTSSLELGIDIGTIDFVTQYLSPRRVSSLIQRTGRAGHKIDETSKGLILTGDEDVFESTVIAKQAMEKNLEEIKPHKKAWDVLAHQIVGLAIEIYGIESNEVFEIVKRAYPFKNLTKEKFLEILRFVATAGFLWLEPLNEEFTNYKIKRSKKSYEYYYGNLSTIPDTRSLRVISVVQDEPIGHLDEEFVAEHGNPGETFICSGRAWRVVEVEDDKILVEPVENLDSAIPAWEGELIPVPYKVAQQVGKIRRFIYENLEKKDLVKMLRNDYPIDKKSAKEMIKLIKKQKKYSLPDHKNIIIEQDKNFIILHSCFGTLVNDTLGRYLSAQISNKTGVSVRSKTDPYRIIIKSPFIKPKMIKDILIKGEDLVYLLKRNISRSSLFKWRFNHVGKRFGIISKKARYEKMDTEKLLSSYIKSPVYEETMREVLLEKMDIKRAKEVIDKIKKNEIKISIKNGPSPIAENGLKYHFNEIMKAKKPKQEIFKAFKKRLLHTRLGMLCTNCKDFHISKEVRDMDEQPICPKCNSILIGFFSKNRRKPIEIMKKKKRRKNLTKSEEKEWKRLERTASLCATYGKKYAFTHAGRGVGVETAARILAKLPKDESTLLKKIFEGEKKYLKTKKYWK